MPRPLHDLADSWRAEIVSLVERDPAPFMVFGLACFGRRAHDHLVLGGRSDEVTGDLAPTVGAGFEVPVTPVEGEFGDAGFLANLADRGLQRLFTALAGLARPAGSGAEVEPRGSLARRTSPALFRALRGAGVGRENFLTHTTRKPTSERSLLMQSISMMNNKPNY